MPLMSEILAFWRGLGPGGWYAVDAAVDQVIRDRFGAAWEAARLGAHGDWPVRPDGALAYLILTDQFPRNMHRSDALAFATDGIALAAAGRAIDSGLDRQMEGPLRQFFYLPFMHSEVLADQDRAVRMIADWDGSDNLPHAEAHRDVIRQFGRFPYRNAALGRATTPAEQAFLDAGGYAAAVRARLGK